MAIGFARTVCASNLKINQWPHFRRLNVRLKGHHHLQVKSLEDQPLNIVDMRCLWRLIPWPKRQKLHDEEDNSLLPGKTAPLHSWEMSRKKEPRSHDSQSGVQERYVRVGIGGAGNLRKSGSISSVT